MPALKYIKFLNHCFSLLLCVGFFLPPELFAEDPSSTPVVLPPVTIIDSLDIQAKGSSTLTRGIIDRLPRGNGSINEVLDILPDVQFSEGALSSKTGGEITPPDISISGGKVFQNYFAIDGVDNNNLIDPMARNPNEITDVPGHPQQLFIDTGLIEELNVYDSNIPARYGDFTGGVVDARLRNPGREPRARLSWRHTQDTWTKFHIQDEDRYNFEKSGDASRQPHFRKDHVGVGLDIPVNDQLGFLLDVQHIRSDIPLLHLGREETQSRRNSNLFARMVYDRSADDYIDLSLIYAPYQADYFIRDTENSAFNIDGGGARIDAGYHRFWDTGEFHLKFFGRQGESRRDAPLYFRNWLTSSSKPWGSIIGSSTSREGGFGDIDQTQDSLGIDAETTLSLDGVGDIRQEINSGIHYQWHRGAYDRPGTTYLFNEAIKSSDVICTDDLIGCIDEEQYFSRRSVYRASSLDESIQEAAFFVDDRLTFGNLSVRPGLRLSYDNYLENLNPAPRLAVEWDILGNGKTVLIGGLNRYYGRSFLAFKLREAKLPVISQYRPKRNNAVGAGSLAPGEPVSPTDPGLWELYPSTLQSVARFSSLDTPYSDEAVLGVDQSLFGGRLSLKYVRRRGKDEFARQYGPVQDDGLRYYTMNNNGRSEHDSVRTSWERAWEKQYLLLTWTWQESSSSNENYNAFLDEEDLTERVWYKGEIVYRSELPRTDFNRPHTVELFYTADFPYGFRFTNFARFLSSYHSLENTWEERVVPGSKQRFDAVKGEFVDETLYVYDDVKRGAEVLVDWKLSWRGDVFGTPEVGLYLDVLNVFNRRVESGVNSGDYRLGRQLWAGMEMSF
ncbi:TonB-dependent receptor plug domain-containing protein [Geothermobacter hydrogeniphilus]|nr:TonB-dependent receptor plug domain-containing protein [Geothermobacter hydrogeniphilus]